MDSEPTRVKGRGQKRKERGYYLLRVYCVPVYKCFFTSLIASDPQSSPIMVGSMGPTLQMRSRSLSRWPR